MKLSFFLKTLSALSLMIALSVIVRSNAQQPVRAQTQQEVEADALSESDCGAVLAAVGAVGEEYSIQLSDFQGIELTPEQEAAYRRADVARSAEDAAALETIPTEVIEDGGIMTIFKDGVTIPDDVLQEIIRAGDAATTDEVPNSEQVDELNAKYEQYAEFELNERILFTPEDIAGFQERRQQFINTVLSILTPEQQPIYLRNLETERALLDYL